MVLLEPRDCILKTLQTWKSDWNF